MAMLTPADGGSYGLGAVVDITGGDVEFGHEGASAGQHGVLSCRVHEGTGLVALANGESGRLVAEVIASALGVGGWLNS